MATLKVVGSGSKENCYLLQTEKESLILELGCKWNEVLEILDYKIEKVLGVLISHAHS